MRDKIVKWTVEVEWVLDLDDLVPVGRDMEEIIASSVHEGNYAITHVKVEERVH